MSAPSMALLAVAAAALLAGCRSAPPAEPPPPTPREALERSEAARQPPRPPATPAAEVATAEVARAPADPTAPPELAARFERPTVVFETDRGQVPVTVELALTPEQQAQGLMYRQYLPDGQGMLFVFPGEAVQTFWMKNTLIELDMIHIAGDGRVVGVVERAEPETLTARRVGVPARYVLEVPGGWSRRFGVGPGTRARFAHIDSAR